MKICDQCDAILRYESTQSSKSIKRYWTYETEIDRKEKFINHNIDALDNFEKNFS